MLIDGNEDESDYVKDQIKNLDRHLNNQGLFDLKSESDRNEVHRF